MIDEIISVGICTTRISPIVIHIAIDPASIGIVLIRRQKIAIIASIQMPSQEQLLRIVQAHDALGFRLGLGQRRQQKTRQNRDNRDHDE